jgi:hypothetical protein
MDGMKLSSKSQLFGQLNKIPSTFIYFHNLVSSSFFKKYFFHASPFILIFFEQT